MPQSDKHHNLTYRDAGVDIDVGNALIERIKPLVKRTRRAGVLGGLGGFGGLFELPTDRYREPVLVAGTDGVGTKLRLAIELGIHDTIGIDLVAMCVNDVVVQGAEPLLFLDYFATATLELEVATEVIAGIAQGCGLAGAALLGGETAEMPGMYQPGDYDLAGFCVGVVEKAGLIDGSKVQPGDCLLGLASSGPHANGYSLIRKVLEVAEADLDEELDGVALGMALLEPTRIYVRSVLALIAACPVHAVAHITGGGLLENLPRVLPVGTRARINPEHWAEPAVFGWLAASGGIAPLEMYRTFNCGLGMVICVPAEQADEAARVLTAAGETVFAVGVVEVLEEGEPEVVIEGVT